MPATLRTLVYDSIKDYILTGPQDENLRITEDFWTRRLGVSASPVREALSRLEAQGLIGMVPRKGAYIRRLSIHEVLELYDVREALETYVVRTAQVTEQLLEALRANLDRQRFYLNAGDHWRRLEATAQFDLLLARATKNAHLVAILENHDDRLRLSEVLGTISSTTAVESYELVVEALEANDRDRAESAIRAHTRRLREDAGRGLTSARRPAADLNPHNQVRHRAGLRLALRLTGCPGSRSAIK